MNQDHIQQQPAADAYVIGGPSEFAEDVSNAGPAWKADLGSDGNTKRDEIGLPEFRSDTFNKSDTSPGVSPSRQASVEEIHAKAEVATKVARLMLSKTASERAIENQALALMDLPLANLRNTLTRLAEDQGQDEEDDDDGDDGQDKQAQDQSDDDEDEASGEQKQAKGLPPEFLKNIQKKKDEAKGKDDDKDEKKEASRRKAQQQQDDGDEDDGQQKKQARRVKAQDQDQDEDEGQQKQARRVKAQDQQDDGDEDGQQKKQARRVKGQQQQDDGDDGQQKEAADQDEKKEGQEEEKQVGKEAYKLIKQAATDLLAAPLASRGPIFKAMLPSLARVASFGMEQQGQQQLSSEQLQAQVQQLVQQAMQQQQQGAQQQQPQLGQQQPQQISQDQALVDQMLQEPSPLDEDQIQLDAPDMDLGLGGEEDPALQAIFASDIEVQRALEARDIERGHQPTAQTRTASTRTVGTRPTAGVSMLGGGTSGSSSSNDEINRLAGMWSSAPDVSAVFRS